MFQWNYHHQMHMLRLHIHFQHFYLFFLLAQLIHFLLGIFSNRILEYSVSVLRTKHKMMLVLVERM